MKTKTTSLLLLVLTPVLLFAQNESDPIVEFFDPIEGGNGKVILNARLRYETVEQDGIAEEADALTVRTRLGYQLKAGEGLSFLAEGEFIQAIIDDYNGAGRNPDTLQFPIIADPEEAELNRLWVAFNNDSTSAKVGRQLLTFDDHRWVGHVGWRQNIQTMDSVFLSQKVSEKVKASYAYVDRVNRIFGDKGENGGGPTGVFNSQSHLLNVNVGTSAGNLALFGYLVELDNAQALSSNTFGARFSGKFMLEDGYYGNAYSVSIARQSDYGNNPVDYDAWYVALDYSILRGPSVFGAGWEMLGSDDGKQAVSSPLATLHKFNGFADVFLSTPAAGLKDLYFYVGHKFQVGKGLSTKIIYHMFESDVGGTDLGSEIDFVASYPIRKYLSATLKYASYEKGDLGSAASRDKLWLQIDFAY
ncbi:MAG: alginate export family protein [Opitutales bacterium]|nr:alginate export family protein [Opitutales bacterium]